MVVEGLLYTRDHEWVKIENNIAIVGITDHAQEMMGELTFVELPAVGGEYQFRDEMAVVESSKAASDVYCPLVGRVAEVNSELESRPELINQDCYEAGWICKMEITDKSTIDGLMDDKQYEQYLKEI